MLSLKCFLMGKEFIMELKFIVEKIYANNWSWTLTKWMTLAMTYILRLLTYIVAFNF